MIWPFSTIADLRAKLISVQDDAARWERIAGIKSKTIDELDATKMELARQLAGACRERDEAREKWREADYAETMLWGDVMALREVMKAIAAAGAASKNGTARKLARMAGEALG